MKDRKKIIKNCEAASGFNGEGVTNINAERFVDLLDSFQNARGELGRQCRDLLNQMEAAGWRITAGIHAGGIGGQGRAADPREHITLRTRGGTYHLRLGPPTAKGDLRLIEITP